jgi:hypothetical protein
MNRTTIIATWSWLIITILVEVATISLLSTASWELRGAVDSLVALSAVIPLIMIYMGLWDEHISVKMFVVVALFFCVDLILIWSASSVH